jgi:hypothetical protein
MPLSLNGTTGIVTGNIAASNITTATIADLNVTTTKLANGAVSFAKLLSTDWTGTVALAGSQKLPSGLIIKWGSAGASTAGVAFTFPTPFPTSAFCIVGTNNNQTNPPAPSLSSLSTTGFTATVSSGTPNFYWIALGN